jgi:hypothetical protein
MAYVSQEMKAKLAPTVKALLKKYGLKGSLSVRNHSTLALTISQGKIDFIGNFNETCSRQPKYNDRQFIPAEKSIQVNTYWCHEHFSGKAAEFLVQAVQALKGPDFFDHSDIQTDYFHCSHYVDINIGRWNKPYALVK